MNPQDLFDIIVQKKWLALTSVIIGLAVRLLKDDTKIPVSIPPRLRSWFALFLGAVSGVVDKLVQAGNTTWTVALLQGFGLAALAMLMHSLLIDSLRDGKELVVPGLMLAGVSPGPGKPPSIPAPSATTLPAPPDEAVTEPELATTQDPPSRLKKCDKPPSGWSCSRGEHEGSCAATRDPPSDHKQ